MEQDFNLLNRDHLNRTALHYAVMTLKLVRPLVHAMGYPQTAEDCLKKHPLVFSYLVSLNSMLLESKNANGNTPESLLQRDITSEDIDTREQAQLMLNQLHECTVTCSVTC